LVALGQLEGRQGGAEVEAGGGLEVLDGCLVVAEFEVDVRQTQLALRKTGVLS
jgi:hypothetical protein